MDQVFNALAHPLRRQVLELLKAKDMPAGEIAAAVPVAWPTLSGHLGKLKDAGLVHVDRQGTSLIYSLNLSVLEDALLAFMARVGVDRDREGANS